MVGTSESDEWLNLGVRVLYEYHQVLMRRWGGRVSSSPPAPSTIVSSEGERVRARAASQAPLGLHHPLELVARLAHSSAERTDVGYYFDHPAAGQLCNVNANVKLEKSLYPSKMSIHYYPHNNSHSPNNINTEPFSILHISSPPGSETHTIWIISFLLHVKVRLQCPWAWHDYSCTLTISTILPLDKLVDKVGLKIGGWPVFPMWKHVR